jgi:hypothetical protein
MIFLPNFKCPLEVIRKKKQCTNDYPERGVGPVMRLKSREHGNPEKQNEDRETFSFYSLHGDLLVHKLQPRRWT